MPLSEPQTAPGFPAPFHCGPFAVRPDWIDANGHLNLAYYIMLFDWATDALWRPIGLGDALRSARRGTFAAEAHTLYLAELLDGDTVVVESQLLAVDAKRLHVAHEMRRAHDGAISARQELMYLSVDLDRRRVAPWPEAVAAGLAQAVDAHAGLAWPDWAGRRIAMPSPASASPTASTAPAPA